MPAVEAGWFLVEVSRVLVLPVEARARLVEWALSLGGAVLVTRPSPVVVEGPLGPVLVSAGVGSLVAPEEPPVGVGVLRLRRREWVDGCRVSGEPRVAEGSGGRVEASGTVVALDVGDPAALLVNGVGGRHVLAPGAPPEAAPVASLDSPRGPPVLSRAPDGSYVVHALEGEAAGRLAYIAPLASACGGRGG